ncbi:MAG: hypothetical protein ACOVQ2_01455 [Flavobacterium sp.]
MESKDLKFLLEKYENAATTIEEENILRNYFKKNDASSEKFFFDYYTNEQNISTKIQTKSNVIQINWKIPVIAASFIIGLIIATFWMGANKPKENESLGTYTNPDQAYKETIKALEMVSVEINKGIEQAKYLNEFENTKNLIFKNNP